VVTGDMGSCCRRKERRRPVAGGGRGCSGWSLLPIAALVCGWREWRGAAVRAGGREDPDLIGAEISSHWPATSRFLYLRPNSDA
jgi:hypothetical protein